MCSSLQVEVTKIFNLTFKAFLIDKNSSFICIFIGFCGWNDFSQIIRKVSSSQVRYFYLFLSPFYVKLSFPLNRKRLKSWFKIHAKQSMNERHVVDVEDFLPAHCTTAEIISVHRKLWHFLRIKSITGEKHVVYEIPEVTSFAMNLFLIILKFHSHFFKIFYCFIKTGLFHQP